MSVFFLKRIFSVLEKWRSNTWKVIINTEYTNVSNLKYNSRTIISLGREVHPKYYYQIECVHMFTKIINKMQEYGSIDNSGVIFSQRFSLH